MEADVRQVLDMLDDRLTDMTWPVWQARIAELCRQHPLVVEGKGDPLQPNGLVLQTARLLKKDAIITTDVGQHQMWAAQVCPLRHVSALFCRDHCQLWYDPTFLGVRAVATVVAGTAAVCGRPRSTLENFVHRYGHGRPAGVYIRQ